MRLEPPLTRREGWLVWWWFMITGTAAAALFLGVFWWWGLFIISIPVLIAAYFAPTAWIYLTLGLLVWLPLRTRPQLGRAAVAAALLLVGVGVPAALNLWLGRAVQAAAASDRGRPLKLKQGDGTIALLDDWSDGGCRDDCLRLLLTGRASAVLVGPALSGAPEAGRVYRRFRIAEWADDVGCLFPAGIENFVRSEHLELIVRKSKCMAMDRAPLGAARLILTAQRSSRRGSSERLPALAIEYRRLNAYGWQAGQPQPLLRWTEASAPRVAMPLALLPLAGADSLTATHWWRAGPEFRAGRRVDVNLMAMLAETMLVPELDNPR